MKVAITGKGGAGKTTVAVMLARYLAVEGNKVIVIDADPDGNTAMALGLDESVEVKPIIEMKELILERTGAAGSGGQFFSLNPKVDDIPEEYAVEVDGVHLLRMGRLKKGGAGCMCPENAFVKSLLSHLLIGRDDFVILDMEAGIEHLGRGTAQGVDMMLAVVDSGRRSIQTAFSVREFAADIGIGNVGVMINKYRNEKELEFIESQVSPLPVVGRIPYSDSIAASDLDGACPYRNTQEQRRWIEQALSLIPARS